MTLSRRVVLKGIQVDPRTGSAKEAISCKWLSKCLSVMLEAAGVRQEASFELMTKGANRDVFKGAASSGDPLALKLQRTSEWEDPRSNVNEIEIASRIPGCCVELIDHMPRVELGGASFCVLLEEWLVEGAARN